MFVCFVVVFCLFFVVLFLLLVVGFFFVCVFVLFVLFLLLFLCVCGGGGGGAVSELKAQCYVIMLTKTRRLKLYSNGISTWCQTAISCEAYKLATACFTSY